MTPTSLGSRPAALFPCGFCVLSPTLHRHPVSEGASAQALPFALRDPGHETLSPRGRQRAESERATRPPAHTRRSALAGTITTIPRPSIIRCRRRVGERTQTRMGTRLAGLSVRTYGSDGGRTRAASTPGPLGFLPPSISPGSSTSKPGSRSVKGPVPGRERPRSPGCRWRVRKMAKTGMGTGLWAVSPGT